MAQNYSGPVAPKICVKWTNVKATRKPATLLGSGFLAALNQLKCTFKAHLYVFSVANTVLLYETADLQWCRMVRALTDGMSLDLSLSNASAIQYCYNPYLSPSSSCVN